MAKVEGNPALPDINALNEAEKRHLLHVMKRAKDFEVIEENKLRQPLEGVLSKFTNVVKGWQPRWFALDPGTGHFSYYYMPSDYEGQASARPRPDQRPRGTMHLMGAVIAPSEEDSQTFNVNAANGEIYKLRAHDAKERQYWVNRLRATAEFHNQSDRGRSCISRSAGGEGFAAALDSPATDSISSASSFSLPLSPSANSIASNKSNASATNVPRGKGASSGRRMPPEPPRRALPSVPQSSSSHALQSSGGVQVPTKSAKPPMATPGVPAPFRNVREVLFLAQDRQEALAALIEDLPQAKRSSAGPEVPRPGEHPLTCLNRDLLQIKATSAATMSALDACLGILLVQQQSGIFQTVHVPENPQAPPPLRPSAAPQHPHPPLEKQKSKSRVLPTPPTDASPVDAAPAMQQQQPPTEIKTTLAAPAANASELNGSPSPATTTIHPPSSASVGAAVTSDGGVISDDAAAVLGGVEGSVSTPPTMRLAVATPAPTSGGVASAASPSDSFCSASDDQFLSLSRGTPPSTSLVIPSLPPSADPPFRGEGGKEADEDEDILSSSPAAIVPVVEEVGLSTASSAASTVAMSRHYRHEDEQEDKEYKETDLGAVDEQHKSVILHLLSQLKMGMDLTKVVLPTFILERRSLLEMYADCMAHPNLFVNVANGKTCEDRMYALFLWYLTSFHEGRKGAIAKKPYNPIIGEIFRCSWSAESCDPRAPSSGRSSSPWGISYVAEQVSHHPPISAFYAESADGRILLNASIWTRSKFMGMSVGVTLVGKVTVYLPQFGEEYVFTLPSAYARSILTTPWVELGDRVTISCPQSGFNAAVTFHTKPFYGGTLHKISGEVKGPDGGIVYRTAGEWNGAIEITREGTNQTHSFDTKRMRVIRKRVRPAEMQEDNESRRLWRDVTASLDAGDVESATEAKSRLEQTQREGERARAAAGRHYPWRFFRKEGESTWVYHDLDEKLSKANPSFRRNAAVPASTPDFG